MGSKSSKDKKPPTATTTATIVHDENFLKTIGLGKGDIPTIEQIGKMWAHYDKDKNGMSSPYYPYYSQVL